MQHAQYEKRSTRFYRMIKLDERKMFTGSTTPWSWPKISETQMMMCNLSVVANLLVYFAELDFFLLLCEILCF